MKILLDRSLLLMATVLIPLTACAATKETVDTKVSPVYYSDCSVVNLQSSDGKNMTKAELIAAEENTLFDSLDESRECNDQALKSGQEAVAAASAGAGQGTGANGSGNSGALENGIKEQGTEGTVTNGTAATDSTVTEILEQISQSNSGTGGGATGVKGQEVTVCQISKDNLAAATTPEDKSFWQSEVDKNCN